MKNLDKWFYILTDSNGHEEETILRKNIELKTLFDINNVYVEDYIEDEDCENKLLRGNYGKNYGFIYMSNNLDDLNKLKTNDESDGGIDMNFFVSEGEMFLETEMKYYKENNKNNNLDENTMSRIL